MKKISFWLISALVVGIFYLSVKGSEMQEIRTEVDIMIPVSTVWAALTDVEKWQDWSPIIKRSSGSTALGSRLEITMVGKGGKNQQGQKQSEDGPSYTAEIIQFDAPHKLRWRAYMMAGFILTNDKMFELEESAYGTKLIHKEMFSGMLAPVFMGHMKKNVPLMLNSMNVALKHLLENPQK